MQAEWFAGRLKELRKKAGLTQPQLAERAGMNKFGIAKLEQGVTQPSWETVIALCKALGVGCDSFTQEPSAQHEPKIGRPPSVITEDVEQEPKKPRGRPRKDAGTQHAAKADQVEVQAPSSGGTKKKGKGK